MAKKRPRRQGHFCRICHSRRSNESFSGKGHRTHVCKACARLPKDKRKAIEDTDEIWSFLRQSHISDKNIARLKGLTHSPSTSVATLAQLILEIGRVHPYKKRRLKFLGRGHGDLVDRLRELAFAEEALGGFGPPDYVMEFLMFDPRDRYDEFDPSDEFDLLEGLAPPDGFSSHDEAAEFAQFMEDLGFGQPDLFLGPKEFGEFGEFVYFDHSQRYDDCDDFDEAYIRNDLADPDDPDDIIESEESWPPF
jgi:hypothetical protein